MFTLKFDTTKSVAVFGHFEMTIGGETILIDLNEDAAAELFVKSLLHRARKEETEAQLITNLKAGNYAACLTYSGGDEFEFPAAVKSFAETYGLVLERAKGKVREGSIRIIADLTTGKETRAALAMAMKELPGFSLTATKPVPVQDKDGDVTGYSWVIQPLA